MPCSDRCWLAFFWLGVRLWLVQYLLLIGLYGQLALYKHTLNHHPFTYTPGLSPL